MNTTNKTKKARLQFYLPSKLIVGGKCIKTKIALEEASKRSGLATTDIVHMGIEMILKSKKFINLLN